VAEEVPGNWEWAKDGKAEEPVRVAEESEAGRKGARRSEKAKVPEEGGLTKRVQRLKTYERLCAYLHETTNIGVAAPAGEYMEV